jgi:uncharacterized membrane protein
MTMLIPPPPAGLIKLFAPWNKFYSDSKLTETLVQFAHTAGLVVAGGIAIATDRMTLRAGAWTDADRRHHLDELAMLHRTVIAGLTITILSGLAMLTSDLETFLGSWIYWVKMLMVVLLLVNGAQMQNVETKLALDSSPASPHWARLRTNAIASITLWLSVTLAGIALLNFA